MSRDSYPYNKNNIPRPVQIVTVCDMYDALTEKRTYGKENSTYDALRIISDEGIDKELYLMIASCKEK